jgi:hypothetical protein
MRTSPDDRPDHDVVTGDLRSLARKRAAEALKESVKARRKAERHHAVMYITGLLGVLAGGFAGVAVVADRYPTVAAVAAFVASGAAGAQTVLRSQLLANQQWSRRAGLGRLSQEYETAATAKEEPTTAQMNEFAERWEKLYRPLS